MRLSACKPTGAWLGRVSLSSVSQAIEIAAKWLCALCSAESIMVKDSLSLKFMAKIDPVLVIGYEKIGTIPLDQWKQAILDDIEALRNEFGIAYVTNAKLVVRATNEFGDPLVIKRLSTGATVKHLDTHYYRPACLDYHL